MQFYQNPQIYWDQPPELAKVCRPEWLAASCCSLGCYFFGCSCAPCSFGDRSLAASERKGYLLIWVLLLEADETLFSKFLCPKLLGGRAGRSVLLKLDIYIVLAALWSHLSSREGGASRGMSWKTASSSFVTALWFSSIVELLTVAIRSSSRCLSLFSAPLADPT